MKIIKVLMVVMCLGVIAGCRQQTSKSVKKQAQVTQTKKVNKTPQKKSVPTLFVHGLQGSHKSTDGMISRLEQRVGVKKVLTINVDSNGNLQVEGKYQQVRHPLIQVNFLNNVADTATNALWLTKVLTYVKDDLKVSHVNLVGHSAGNLAIFQSLCQNNNLPKVDHYVSLAGPFDGVITMNDTANANQVDKQGKPQIYYPANDYYPSYQELLNQAASFPKKTKVLLIYGNLEDGSNSDTLVSEASALSLKYLLKNNPLTVKCLKGSEATHSGLHESRKVDLWIADFLGFKA